MSLATILTYLTLAVVLIVVVVLVVYLVAIIAALRRAGDNLEKLAGGLHATVDNTAPLADHLTTINGALSTLQAGLGSVDEKLVGVADVFELRNSD